ncbi:hypothetical protein [Streptomyces cyaneus]|uniref:hypothetical protein n=1 Tax=Streptomyces cyaneus TaxID=1904 RepID=UPI000FF895DD|nr:hypothetical protein [Streptomyces cyaneus]
MQTNLKRIGLGAAATTAAVLFGLASTAQAAPHYLNGKSKTGNAEISGTYEYHVTGHTTSGDPIYGGKFTNAGARDAIPGNRLEAVFALEYYTWSGGAWKYQPRYASRVNSFDSWGFNNKKDIRVWACDRQVGTTTLKNCNPVF